jgi:hypothetical protein
MFWCFHKWVEEGRTLTPGLNHSSKNMEYRGPVGSMNRLMEQMFESCHNHTSILLRCSKCGDYKNRIVRGDFT